MKIGKHYTSGRPLPNTAFSVSQLLNIYQYTAELRHTETVTCSRSPSLEEIGQCVSQVPKFLHLYADCI